MSNHTELVLLIRHAHADAEHPAGDAARPLSQKGRRSFRRQAGKLAKRTSLVGIMTSPFVRAVQTAEILADATGLTRVEVDAELAATIATAEGLEAVARALGPGWALVGHNPSLAECLRYMLGSPEAPSFRKGAAFALRPSIGQTPRWKLDWVLEPRVSGRET